MDHQEIQELLGAYALNAVDPGEAVAVVEHAAHCPDCRSELEDHLEVAALLPAEPGSAPASVWDTISREVAGERHGDAPVAGFSRDVIPLRRRWARPVAVAAALILLGGTAIVQSVRMGAIRSDLAAERATVAALSEQQERPVLDTAVSRALGDPATRQVTLGSQVSGSNAIIVLMPDGTGYLSEHTLRPLPAGRTYQLWAVVGGKVISAGILGPDPGVVPFHIDPEGFEGFAITEEVIGGVESSRNDPVVAWLAA